MKQPSAYNTGTGGKNPRYFYGWNIVGTAFLTQLAYAGYFSSLFGFFIKPIQDEFGWSRAAIAAVQSMSRVTEAITSPLIGPLLDRYGPRVLMPVGALIVGLALIGVTQIHALWQFYILRGLLSAIGFTLMGAMVTSVTINNWFIKKRGRALAIGRVGGNISNIIFTPLTVIVIAASGWQTMFVIFAVLAWVFALIPSALIMRRRPEDMGLYPDGIEPDRSYTGDNEGGKTQPRVVSEPEPLWTRSEVLRTRTFWLLSASFGINSLAFQGINISLAPYIQDLGYAGGMLASVMTFRAAMGGLSLLGVGFLAEYAQRPVIRIIPFIVQGISITMFLLAANPVFLWLGVAFYGLGISSITVIQEVLWANFFGRLNLGMVRSTAFLAAFGLGAAGPVAMNAVYDATGSYKIAFITILGLFALSAAAIGSARTPKASRYANL